MGQCQTYVEPVPEPSTRSPNVGWSAGVTRRGDQCVMVRVPQPHKMPRSRGRAVSSRSPMNPPLGGADARGRLPIARLSLSGELARPRPCDGLASCPSVASHRIPGQARTRAGLLHAAHPVASAASLARGPQRGRSGDGVVVVSGQSGVPSRTRGGVTRDPYFFLPPSSSRAVVCIVLVYAQNIRLFRVHPSVVVDGRSRAV
jgi:hypothetical protein